MKTVEVHKGVHVGVLERLDAEGKVAFSCTADIALDAAYLLSMAEFYAFERSNESTVGEILGDYVAGRISQEEALAEMEESCEKPKFKVNEDLTTKMLPPVAR